MKKTSGRGFVKTIARTNSTCPFCHAKTKVITKDYRKYHCKTLASLVTGLYTKGNCNKDTKPERGRYD